MTRESLLILLGILIVISPFAGLPLSWLSWVLPLIGLIVIFIAAWQRRERWQRQQTGSTAEQ